ncbi:MAG TPA: hypothetical protein VFA69_06180 [Candidatus Nitrosotalea sp.]|nr:hypothetical protein [Candidatus Nitrosotalea sp.]
MVEENLIKTTDGQNKTFPIVWQSDRSKDFPVYRVPIEILSFNFDNGRTASEKFSRERKEGRVLDEDNPKDQDIVADILLHSVWFDKKDTEQLIRSLKIEQRDPAIVTFDGVVIDGNRRMACLVEIFKQTGDPIYKKINVCVLPKAEKKELIFFENQLQLKNDYKVDYGPVNDRLRIRTMKEDLGFTTQEIIRSVEGRFDEADIDRMIEEMKLIDEYLESIGRPKDYASLGDEFNGVESFKGLLDSLKVPTGTTSKAQEKVDKEIRKRIGFQLIHHPKTTYRDLRKFRDVLKNPAACKELMKNSPTYNNTGTGSMFEPQRVQQELNNLELAFGFVESQKSDPINLLQIAKQKLELVQIDRIPKGDSIFTKLVSDIESRLSDIRKKM